MKNIKFILLAAILLLAGCEKTGKDGDVSGSVEGEWHLVSLSGGTAVPDIYISFEADGTFDLYQRVDTPYYQHLDGTYSRSGGEMNGTYADGKPWTGNPYSISFSDGGNTLKMARSSDSGDVSVYVKTRIPSDILAGDLGLKSSSSAPAYPAFRYL